MKYICGLTIGPLTGLLEQARTTREIAVTSLFFSKLAGAAIQVIEAKGCQLILPAKAEYTINYGLYAERVYWLTDIQHDEATLQSIKESALLEIEKDFPNGCKLKLSDLIRLYIAQLPYVLPYNESTEQPLKLINNKLDLFELNDKFPNRPLRSLIDVLIGKGLATGKSRIAYKWRVNNNVPYFRKYASEKRYPMALEIAAAPIFYNKIRDNEGWQYDYDLFKRFMDKLPKGDEGENSFNIEDVFFDEKNQGEILKLLRDTANRYTMPFLQQYKYFCIVYADGDGVGRYLNKVLTSTQEALEPASNKLFEFANQAASLIQDYGGVPVYLGGDDLLFFAPVSDVNNGKLTILNLTSNLDSLFKNILAQPTLSLSFGISIGYYKHPMDKLLKTAGNNLFTYAKHNKSKNTVSLSLTKHSGAKFNLLLNLEGDEFKLVEDIAKDIHTLNDEFIKSVAFKLKDQHPVLELIAKNTLRLDAFFINNFNKEIHDSHQDKIFKKISKLIHLIYANKSNGAPDERLFNILKYFHFLTEKDKNEQI